MKKRTILLTAAIAAVSLSGCGTGGAQQSPIAIVDTNRLLQYWPKFQNDNNQYSVDMATIDRSRGSEAQKNRERYQLQVKYAAVQKELTDDVRSAATQVARDKKFTMVFTREFVGYGGTDITPDVEKILKITEATPSSKP
ncbi:MAG: hypothetical protein M3N19_02945 [Candidatus Eremiobacteraeota bacterium]|nr:hypothetical protein [Candidatus Eremiobacteraeota bacterium]